MACLRLPIQIPRHPAGDQGLHVPRSERPPVVSVCGCGERWRAWPLRGWTSGRVETKGPPRRGMGPWSVVVPARLGTQPCTPGSCRRDVLRASARQEYEAARFEQDPAIITRLIVVGRDAVSQITDKVGLWRRMGRGFCILWGACSPHARCRPHRQGGGRGGGEWGDRERPRMPAAGPRCARGLMPRPRHPHPAAVCGDGSKPAAATARRAGARPDQGRLVSGVFFL